ncbi:MAG: hypothetical protein ABSF96_03415 [Steroidobacteraceae bacterium]
MRAIRKLDESRVAARPRVMLVPTRSGLTATEIAELQRLFDLIADISDAANVILSTGPLDTGWEMDRLRELSERVRRYALAISL